MGRRRQFLWKKTAVMTFSLGHVPQTREVFVLADSRADLNYKQGFLRRQMDECCEAARTSGLALDEIRYQTYRI